MQSGVLSTVQHAKSAAWGECICSALDAGHQDFCEDITAFLCTIITCVQCLHVYEALQLACIADTYNLLGKHPAQMQVIAHDVCQELAEAKLTLSKPPDLCGTFIAVLFLSQLALSKLEQRAKHSHLHTDMQLKLVHPPHRRGRSNLSACKVTRHKRG